MVKLKKEKMTVRDLLDALGDADPDIEIRIAMQPQWPFEYSIGDIALVETEEWDEEEETYKKGDSVREPIIYLSEGRQLGYLPRVVCSQLGWK